MPAIGQIVSASWRQTFHGLLPQDLLLSITPEAQTARHQRTSDRTGVTYHTATRGGEVVGFASCGPARDPGFDADHEIYAIYLKPGFERQGVGRSLFNAATSSILLKGRGGFYLTALAVNPNLGFYLRLGGQQARAPDIRLGEAIYRQVAFLWQLEQSRMNDAS